jgi:pyruvyltransferase
MKTIDADSGVTTRNADRSRGGIRQAAKQLRARWFDDPNWGDALNPVLIERLSGTAPIRVDWRPRPQSPSNPPTLLERVGNRVRRDVRNVWLRAGGGPDILLVIGSTLQHACGQTVAWGPGFIAKSSRCIEPPRRIHAVRGPLTRDRLLSLGIACPEVYGDPALLWPRYYRPDVQSTGRIGIVPHCADQQTPWVNTMRGRDDVLVIDVTAGINEFIDALHQCDRILSSSLHGVIAADAYAIPSAWIKLSDNVVGDGFKFHDYFASVGRPCEGPLLVDEQTRLEQLTSAFWDGKPAIDLDRLMDACPFKNNAL